MFPRHVVGVLFGLLAAAGAQAQRVDRISAGDVSMALSQSMMSGSRGVMFRASSDRNAQYILNRRTGPSEVELHCQWDDILFVRAGYGVLDYGSKLQGMRHYSTWEWRGRGIVAPTQVNLAAGDVVRVPAGSGHVIRNLGDVPLVYLVVKVRSFDVSACGSLPNRGA
jgi:mannose-6-phosphate isomerase-like protein (cupin superfamily)